VQKSKDGKDGQQDGPEDATPKPDSPKPTPGGFFGGMKKMFGLGITPGGEDEVTPGEPEWEEFPWNDYLIK
jgi:hypothetical protein|tara:strand:- start:159 stop:371 length:213 start_codon:yes stop_codon:yes gene_type:complete